FVAFVVFWAALFSATRTPPLAARPPRLRGLPLEIERHCRADEILQGRLIDLVAFVDIDGAPHVSVEAGIEETRRILQLGPLGTRYLAGALVGFSRADDAAVRPDRCAGIRGFRPLPLLDDLRICLVDDRAHFRERLPAPVPESLDPLIDGCRGRFRCDGHF